jgi:hypothetical protein
MAAQFHLRAEGLGWILAKSLQLGLVLLVVLGGLSSLPSTCYFSFSSSTVSSQPAPLACLLPALLPTLGNASVCMKGFPEPAQGWSRAGWDTGQLHRRGFQYPNWAPPPSLADGHPWPPNFSPVLTFRLPRGVGSAELAKFSLSSHSPPAAPLATELLPVLNDDSQQPLTGELLAKFSANFAPPLATEPLVVLGSAQQNHQAAKPLARLGSDSLSLLATESLVGT